MTSTFNPNSPEDCKAREWFHRDRCLTLQAASSLRADAGTYTMRATIDDEAQWHARQASYWQNRKEFLLAPMKQGAAE